MLKKSSNEEKLTIEQENAELKQLVANLLLRNKMLEGRMEKYKTELRELTMKGELGSDS